MTIGTHNLIGKPAAFAYTALLLSHSRVQQIHVFKYRSPPPLQQRIAMTATEQGIIEHALELRRAVCLPFWNAVFAACLIRQQHTPALLSAAFFHSGPGSETPYQRRDLENGLLDQVSGDAARNVGLSSEVRDASGQSSHLGLLDFHCDISSRSEAIVNDICREVMPGGYLILDSGDSYHACTLELLTPEQRVRMLGKTVLATPVVDSSYIAHQLQQDASSIRISKGGKTNKKPVVIQAWRP